MPYNKEYTQLQDRDWSVDDDVSEPFPPISRFRQAAMWSKSMTVKSVVLFLILSNIYTIFVLLSIPRLRALFSSTRAAANIQDLPVVDELPTENKAFQWRTPWGTEGVSEHDINWFSANATDALWDGIQPSHGIVAVDREWARENNWPDSMPLPKDPRGGEKAVYLLEAYHLLHCLKIMRQSFMESQRGTPLTWPPAHALHCYDTMRQSIQCNADNTPLYTWGDFTAGDGQLHKCKSWDTLRDWATEHSACYRDSVEPIPLRDHFGFCEDGEPYHGGMDGLP